MQVLAALLVNRLGDPVRLGEEGFCQAVLGRLASRHRRVYQAAAETVGLLLARLQGELGAGPRDRVARRLEMADSYSSKDKDRWPNSRFLAGLVTPLQVARGAVLHAPALPLHSEGVRPELAAHAAAPDRGPAHPAPHYYQVGIEQSYWHSKD